MNTKSLASGGVCTLIGAAFALEAARSLRIGSIALMGPGFFPLSLAVILIGVGLWITVFALREGPEPAAGRIDLRYLPYRGIALVVASLIVLGLTIRTLGLFPSIFLVSMISAYASRMQTHRMALGISLLLATFCAVLFGMVLKLPIPIIGPWLSF